MLGKLIKNDLKFGAHSVSLVYLTALIASAVMGISLLADLETVKYISSVVFIIAAFAIVIVTVITIIISIQKTMYGSQGYLTHTLPVKTSALVFSKWFTSFFWVFISQLFFYASIVFMYFYVSGEDGFQMIKSILLSGEFSMLISEAVLKKVAILEASRLIIQVATITMYVLFGITLSNVRPFHVLGNLGAVIYSFITILAGHYLGKGAAKLADIAVALTPDKVSVVVTEAAKDAILDINGAIRPVTATFTGVVFAVILYFIIIMLIEKKINIK
jgi:hypothetical protein